MSAVVSATCWLFRLFRDRNSNLSYSEICVRVLLVKTFQTSSAYSWAPRGYGLSGYMVYNTKVDITTGRS